MPEIGHTSFPSCQIGNLILMANIRDSKVSMVGLITLGLQRKLYEDHVRSLGLYIWRRLRVDLIEVTSSL